MSKRSKCWHEFDVQNFFNATTDVTLFEIMRVKMCGQNFECNLELLAKQSNQNCT